MSKTDYQIRYAVDRALENIADLPGIRPVRVHWVAFPLWVADVSAVVTAREPFDLLDRYVGLAIAECGFRSVSEISGYLGLTDHVVHRVLRFLTEIRHITSGDGDLVLTELGLRAARDDTRYTPKEDRLKLYFDGVRCHPLPTRYYGRGVRVLSRSEARDQHKFRLLDHASQFDAEAPAKLARRHDRADYNLPDEHENLKVQAADPAFLPCYLIRARDAVGDRYFAYTAADSSASDAHLEDILKQWPEFLQALQTDENAGADRRAELTKWLDDRGLSMTQLTWAGHDMPRLTLPARCFPHGDAPAKTKGEFPLRQVGSYLTPRSYVMQLWCTDPKIRREAALQRALEYADAGRKDEAEIIRFLEQLSERLETGRELDVSDLRAYAKRTGRGALSI
jgi:hypothetical protein